jgi:uncharacterized protein YeaO (DUF488 family)
LTIKLERIYNNLKGDNSFRILVDRLWPRGLSNDKIKVDLWQKDIAPSNSLRKWFGHDERKWDEFKRRYFKELNKKEMQLTQSSKKPENNIQLPFYMLQKKRNLTTLWP